MSENFNTYFITDSLGYFTFRFNKRKIKINSNFGIYNIDTIIKKGKTNLKLYTIADLDSNVIKYDIEHNKFKVFCGSGFATESNSYKDILTQQKFSFKYVMCGCTLPYSREKIKAYNLAIITSLLSKYGNNFKSNLRKDVIGFLEI